MKEAPTDPVDVLPARMVFGRFELHPHERRLLVDDKPAALGARAFDLLLALVQRSGKLVTKNELLDLVWPGLIVEEANLTVQVSSLRKVLGGELIATIPGHGYRFVAAIESAQPTGTPAPAAAPAATLRPKLKANLAATLTPLIGRTDELAELDELIGAQHLVTIVGAGGMGKTLLAQHLLRRHELRWRHGVCWVELAPVADGAAIPAALAAALDLDPGKGDALGGLAAALAPLELLVVLDNAEHLLEAVARVAAVLRDAAPGLRLVVTSQAPLKLAAERVYRLGALAVPQGPLPAAEALGFGAVALFTERAQAADARFVLTDGATPAVIELCRALDGLALAIELAAARAPMLGVQRLAASMHERLLLLTRSSNRQAPQRQQTLRAALEWSHGLLAPHEQAVFRRLAVVAGSADLSLIQRLAADPPDAGGLDEWAVLDALDVLVERSLVSVLPAALEGSSMPEPRYRLLDSPRAFALERLVDAGEREQMRRSLAQALAGRFDAWVESHFSGRELDLDNLREAFAWARERGERPTAAALGAMRSFAMPQYAFAERMALADDLDSLLTEDLPPRLRSITGWALSHLVDDHQPRRGLAAAASAVAAARASSGAAGDPVHLYLGLCRVGTLASHAGQEAQAAQALAEARGLERADWPAWRLYYRASAEVSLALVQGRREERVLWGRVALAHALAAGWSDHMARLNLIDAELFAGNVQAALSVGQALLAELENSRFETDLAFARLNLLAVRLMRGELPEARALAHAGWPMAPQFGQQAWWADYLALLAALEGRPEAAARLAGYADAVYERTQDYRQANEAQAVERARVLAGVALGEADLQRLQGEGARLGDAEVAGIAFAVPDLA